MKISAITMSKEKDGLQPFRLPMLGDVVLITGPNGAGKTRFLKLIQNHCENLRNNAESDGISIKISDNGVSDELTSENVNDVRIINYSHYDARLQVPDDFSPYVIHKAKEILKKCDYEETALNSLLFVEDLAKGYSEEFADGEQFLKFQKDVKENFGIIIEYNQSSKKLQLFGLDIENAALSPGQQYLLRMAVACFQNENVPGLIFFMDEPELHLHPSALIEMIKRLRDKFPNAQFWISTHSLSLVSYYTIIEEKVTTLFINNQKVDLFRSNSGVLLDGLVGDEENRFAVQQLFGLTEEYACNRFTFECYDDPETLPGTNGNDVEVNMIKKSLFNGACVVDFGAGKGRFLEEMCMSEENKGDNQCWFQYYAYDPDVKDSDVCQEIMEKYGSATDNYFNDLSGLVNRVQGTADFVLLVNVLHEIPPDEWNEIFENIEALLKPSGQLIIVERDKLMVGETPYYPGFLMITSEACKVLFGKNNVKESRHPQKEYIVKYAVNKEGVKTDKEKINRCIQIIRRDSLDRIEEEKKREKGQNRKDRFKSGMNLVFWLHQYANSSLWLRQSGDEH